MQIKRCDFKYHRAEAIMCRKVYDAIKIRVKLHQFYRVSLVLFLASGVFVCLFVLGLHFTRDRHEPTSNTPYFFPDMVAGALFIIEGVTALLMCREGTIIKNPAVNKRDRGKARSRYYVMDVVFFITNIIGIISGIIGVVFTAFGFCVNADRCYYDVNVTENRVIAGISFSLQFVSMFMEFYIVFCIKPDVVLVRDRSKVAPRRQPDTLNLAGFTFGDFILDSDHDDADQAAALSRSNSLVSDTDGGAAKPVPDQITTGPNGENARITADEAGKLSSNTSVDHDHMNAKETAVTAETNSPGKNVRSMNEDAQMIVKDTPDGADAEVKFRRQSPDVSAEHRDKDVKETESKPNQIDSSPRQIV